MAKTYSMAEAGKVFVLKKINKMEPNFRKLEIHYSNLLFVYHILWCFVNKSKTIVDYRHCFGSTDPFSIQHDNLVVKA